MTCSYAFSDANGKPVLITGKESFKAYLVSGGLANFGINLQSDKGEAKLSRSGGSLPDTITVNGVERPTTNSNGKPIHPTEEGVRKFWEWFADSKIVDELGRPLVVYHGTKTSFVSFDRSSVSGRSKNEFGAGFYFASTKSAADLYAGDKGAVIAAYLSLQNPKFVTTSDRGGATGWHGEFDGLIASYADADDMRSPSNWAEIVVANPDQIKSAINNAGTFDPANPDIRFSFAGQSSQTADKHALSSAQSRLDAGESAEKVRQDTGWFKGNDGKWRYEISDADASVDFAMLSNLASGGWPAFRARTVSYRFTDDGKIMMSIVPADAKKTREIVSVTVPNQMLNSLLPDAILKKVENGEGREDFVGDFLDAKAIDQEFDFDGFNALPLDNVLEHAALFSAYPRLRDVMVQIDKQIGGGAQFSVREMSDGSVVRVIKIGSMPIQKFKSALLHEIQHGIQDIEGFATGGTERQMVPENAKDILAQRQSILDKISSAPEGANVDSLFDQLDAIENPSVTASKRYQRLAGEVEARNTQARQSMTDAERRATPPSETADVANSDVIVMFNGKEMASAPKPDNAKGSRGRTREIIHPEDFAATMRAAKRAYPGVQIIGHDSDQANSVPRELKASIKRQGATNDVKGAFHNGEIHIFRNAIPDIHTLEFTVAHEGTHFGLSSKFGPGIDEVMLDINRNNPAVAARAEELQAQYGYSVARSTEEVLADLGGDMVKVKGFARLVAYIRDFLRKHGFVTEWSDNDIAALVMAARDYAKNKNATTVYRGSVFKEGQLPRTTEVDGKQRPTMNSEGRQIHPTEEGVRNFYKWFGDSKIVDAQGRPLVEYHGTMGDFSEFKESRKGLLGAGIYLTPKASAANAYSIMQARLAGGETGRNIMAVYAKSSNPLMLENDPLMDIDSQKIKSMGYDGIARVNNGTITQMTVFDPSQIKSAIGNNGDFSPESPNITYSRTSLISPAQRALTRTDAFKEWFGSSKMTAQDGTPLLFMHGTPAKFDAFDSKHVGANSSHTSAGLGHFFTREVATAQKYADGGTILKGWVKMERPYVMPLKEAQAFESAKDSAARRMELQQKGYDGAVILDDQGKPWATVAFHPWQFKSTENKGAFDEFDDRFRFSRTNQGQAGAWPIEPIGKGDRFIYNMQNKQIDTKRVVEAAKKSGVNVTDDINPYLQEELYHGRSAKKFDDFRNKELRPLLDSIRAAGLSLADVESYLWASHAKERNAQIAKINDKMPDGGSGLTNKQADDLLAGRNVTVNGNEIKGVSQSALPVMQGIAKQVQAINAATRQMLVDSGMETADTIKAWEGAYSNYVPLHREDIEQGGMGTGMGFSVRGSASKRAIGSGRTVVDILGNIANQRERQIARVEKNRVGQAVLGLAKSAPNEDFWKVDDVPMMKTVEATPVFTAYDKAGKVLGTYNTQLQADRAHPSIDVTIRRTVEDKVKERIDPTFRSKDEVFHVRVDGKDHFVTFNPQDERSMRMAMALKNLDADQLGAVLQVTSKATRFFASMATQYNPIWGVVNLTRDVQGALLNLSTTNLKGKEKEVLGHTLSALKGIYADLRAHRAGKKPSSKWASLFEEMQDEGGQTGYKDMFGNAKDRTEALERELDPTKWMRSPLGRIFTADGRLKVPMEIAQKRAEGFFGWLSDFNQTTENAIRLASYKTAVDSGMSKQQAASIAKNVSINFNRRGQVATQAGALYAFFNASMQGSARLAETLRGPLGKKIIKGGLALGMMQAMMLSAAGMGDDEPPEFVRERSFIIPIGDGKYFSIPLPLGFHVLPNLSRIPTEYAMSGFKNGGKRIADLFGLVADTFNPIGNAGLSLQTIAPTVIDPLAALAENKDYTGKRIAKEDMSSLHPTPGYLRAKDTASEISKYFAKVFNAASGGTEFKKGEFSPTPDQLDYLIGQVLGGVGREALKIDQTISSAVTGEELPMHKVPLLGRFVGDTKGQSAESGKFYAALTRINEHQAELKGLRASGRSAEAAEYAKENPEARLVLMATATERALSEDHKLKRKAIAAGNSDLVKQIEARSSARIKAFNERLAALEN